MINYLNSNILKSLPLLNSNNLLVEVRNCVGHYGDGLTKELSKEVPKIFADSRKTIVTEDKYFHLNGVTSSTEYNNSQIIGIHCDMFSSSPNTKEDTQNNRLFGLEQGLRKINFLYPNHTIIMPLVCTSHIRENKLEYFKLTIVPILKNFSNDFDIYYL